MGVELPGDIGLRDRIIMRGEMIALIAKRADPDLSSEIDAREGIEDGRARLAAERGIREVWNVRVRTDQADVSSKGDDALASFDLGAGPCVPCHADSVNAFGICVRQFRHYCLVLRRS